jgi:hypothetical protein
MVVGLPLVKGPLASTSNELVVFIPKKLVVEPVVL